MFREPMTRRRLLSSALSAIGAIGASDAAGAWTPQCPQGSIAPPPTSLPVNSSVPLGSLAASKGLKFGVGASYVTDSDYGNGIYDPIDEQLIMREMPHYITPGNAFRFQQLCPDPPVNGQLSFTQMEYGITDTWWQANDITSIFKSRGIELWAHAMIWQESSPSWLAKLPVLAWQSSSAYKSNLNYMGQFISASVKKMIQLSAGNPNYIDTVALINEPIDYFNLVAGGATYTSGPFLPRGVPIASSAVAGYITTALQKFVYYNQYWSQALRLPKLNSKILINFAGTENDQFGPIVRPAVLALVRKIK
eukprot:gene23139-24501_t